ncbi:lipopolysaccharide biosynthesis protein [Empedobacter falsenii]|uniref:lipopolysaccharide biosynthesis protein n=1 Tax=Empedobacter falsenii TaxID=343874 RepID=UPI001C565768|nr:oligosaccharide flippase family protein [Empedobacter falsenii]MBW1619742.1 oligosaccharide flippase family protein [Empedobacter falsenii]
MKDNKSLLKLTILYTIGNLSSKVISFVLVFFTTFYLSKEDVGAYDLILITLSLLSPFVTFQLTDAALRWLLDNDTVDNKKRVFSTISFILVFSHLGLYCLMYLYNWYSPIAYFHLLFFLVFFQSIYLFLLQCIRGLGKNKMYVGVGLINTFIYVGLAILSLTVFNFKVEGLLYSSMVSGIVTSLILLFSGNLYSLWDKESISIAFGKTLLQYSIPLIPNSLSWWAISSANRYIILLYLGAAANGIFAIAFKLPTILLMFVNIFYLAWQEKSILSYEREGRDEYYSTVLKKYVRILFSLSILIVATNKIALTYLVSEEFFEAWQYTPILLLSIILSSIAGFYGTGYLSAKKTRGALTSSLFGGLVTVGLSFLLIPKFGLFGASFAVLFGYLVLLVIRIIHMKNIFSIVFPYKLVIIMTFLLILVSALNYGNKYVLFLNVIMSVLTLLILNKENLKEFINKRSK